MVATTFLPVIPRLTHMRFSSNNCDRRNGLVMFRKVVVNAKQGESEGKSMDENMVVLRMRIKKMKVLESSHEQGAPAPSDWEEWEKILFMGYHEGVELLRSYLMNTRPSVALGMLALLAMSVPVSTSVVMVNALKVAKGLLAGCHVCIDIDF